MYENKNNTEKSRFLRIFLIAAALLAISLLVYRKFKTDSNQKEFLITTPTNYSIANDQDILKYQNTELPNNETKYMNAGNINIKTALQVVNNTPNAKHIKISNGLLSYSEQTTNNNVNKALCYIPCGAKPNYSNLIGNSYGAGSFLCPTACITSRIPDSSFNVVNDIKVNSYVTNYNTSATSTIGLKYDAICKFIIDNSTLLSMYNLPYNFTTARAYLATDPQNKRFIKIFGVKDGNIDQKQYWVVSNDFLCPTACK